MTVSAGLPWGVVIPMEQYSKKHVVGLLNRLGHTQLAEEAQQVLPDPVDVERLGTWLMEHGVSRDDLISQMGGSP